MLKTALIGVGGISGAHIPAWENIKEAELTAICDIRPEQMQKYPNIRSYTDFDEMLEKEESFCTFFWIIPHLQLLQNMLHVSIDAICHLGLADVAFFLPIDLP